MQDIEANDSTARHFFYIIQIGHNERQDSFFSHLIIENGENVQLHVNCRFNAAGLITFSILNCLIIYIAK